MGLRTPLFDSHLALGARMMDFGGWEMPLQYAGVLAEHNAVRSSAGVFDTGHMGAFLVEGSDSLERLSYIVTQNLRTLAVGGCRYGFMLNEEGGIIDDLIVYRLGEHSWMPVVNAGTAPRDLKWITKWCRESATTVSDLRNVQVKIDLQGPDTVVLAQRVLQLDISALRRFRWQEAELFGATCIISRTGYTGEDGVEFYAPPDIVTQIWNALLEAGVQPCGLGARDTLRLEAGFPLYGHEMAPDVSPAEASMMQYASKEEPFIGREAMLERATRLETTLVPFEMGGRQTARHGQVVRYGGDERGVGVVTSGSFGPSVGRAIGFAYIEPIYSAEGTEIFVDNGRALLPAKVARLPFLKKQ